MFEPIDARPDSEARDVPLPAPPKPQGHYVPAVVHRGIAYSAGMTPRVDGKLLQAGRVGAEIAPKQARELAAHAAANALAAVAAAAGGLDRIACCLRLTVYVASEPTFTGHSLIADGASALLRERLGERGRVARSAVGVASLPSGAPVEVELMAALVEVPG